ncbi:toxin-antitoxin system TumE family protein [Pyrodictium abyssi]|uniref:Uncharacterized protein n=1 Tax=Pyrodictium abyssi TaxID=54256 RepID=A0ABN6ZU82_9CREN|nr:hypothetical protein PABY_19520 [Pyrodictium abyssi]
MPGLPRIRRVAALLRGRGYSVSLVRAVSRPGFFSYRLRARRRGVLIYVSEVWLQGRLARYAYTLVVGGRAVLRYDNAPHHPGLSTYPHHVHREGRVEPLERPSLEGFLEEAETLLRRRGL